MRIILVTVLSLLFLSSAYGQKLPKTNLYLFDMKVVADSIYRFSNPKLLSSFNTEGYNNQPGFISDNELLVTVQLSSDTTQTDIYKMDIEEMELARFTRTEESEFSPTLMLSAPPGISTVRVEKDGVTQRLWQYPLDRSTVGSPVFRTIEGIGYHYWKSSRDVLLFLVGTPHRLVSANTSNETSFEISTNIGRCFQRMASGDIAYVHKTSDNSWLLKRLNRVSYYSDLITETLPGSEDFVLLPDGTFLMGNGSKLYKFHPNKDVSWVEVGDFSYYGFGSISRLAVSGNKLVMVTQ